MEQLDPQLHTRKVLDHGFVRLIRVAGDDQFIGQAARVSYGGGTRPQRELRSLIDYLWEMRHTSPFEQCVYFFHVKCPIFVARQWIRHRTARLNEVSGRYSVMKDEFYIPETDELWCQDQTNRQGSSLTIIEDPAATRDIMQRYCKELYEDYQNFLSKGLARETSRILLPLNLYTEFYWQMDLHNLLHFLHLRMDSHAQYHIRVFAEPMYDFVKAFNPLAAQSFERHTLNARTFSSDELAILRRLLPDTTVLQQTADTMRDMPEFASKDGRKVPAFFRKLGVELPR